MQFRLSILYVSALLCFNSCQREFKSLPDKETSIQKDSLKVFRDSIFIKTKFDQCKVWIEEANYSDALTGSIALLKYDSLQWPPKLYHRTLINISQLYLIDQKLDSVKYYLDLNHKYVQSQYGISSIQNCESLDYLGNYHRRVGNMVKAMYYFQQSDSIISSLPSNTPLWNRTMLNLQYDFGLCAFEIGDLVTAESCFWKVKELSIQLNNEELKKEIPWRLHFIYQLSSDSFSLKQINDLTPIKQMPEEFQLEYHLVQATAAFNQGKYHSAILAFHHSAQYYIDDPDLQKSTKFNIASCYAELGNADSLFLYANQAIQMDSIGNGLQDTIVYHSLMMRGELLRDHLNEARMLRDQCWKNFENSGMMEFDAIQLDPSSLAFLFDAELAFQARVDFNTENKILNILRILTHSIQKSTNVSDRSSLYFLYNDPFLSCVDALLSNEKDQNAVYMGMLIYQYLLIMKETSTKRLDALKTEAQKVMSNLLSMDNEKSKATFNSCLNTLPEHFVYFIKTRKLHYQLNKHKDQISVNAFSQGMNIIWKEIPNPGGQPLFILNENILPKGAIDSFLVSIHSKAKPMYGTQDLVFTRYFNCWSNETEPNFKENSLWHYWIPCKDELPETGKEGNFIAIFLKGKEISLNQLTNVSKSNLHIATHGVFVPNKNEFGLLNGNCNITASMDTDQVIVSSAVRSMHLPNKFIYLNICYGNELTNSRYEMSQSLATSFIDAGASIVLSSRGPIHDAAARQLAESYYTNCWNDSKLRFSSSKLNALEMQAGILPGTFAFYTLTPSDIPLAEESNKKSNVTLLSVITLLGAYLFYRMKINAG